MAAHCADPTDGAELLATCERLRKWRLHDALRTNPEVIASTPVLGGDSADLAAAIALSASRQSQPFLSKINLLSKMEWIPSFQEMQGS